MIKKLFLVFASFSLLALAQDKQNPNVELPDFVITGRDIVSIQKAKKIQPALVSTVSQDFFKPNFSPDELGIGEISNPISNKLNLSDTLKNYNGYLELGLGGYTLPKAKVIYSAPFSSGIFNTYFNGNNTLNYIENNDASKSIWDAGVNLSYFADNDVTFWGGTKLKFHGNYGVSKYKLFGSATRDLRNLNKGDVSFDINNLLNKQFIIDVKISDQYTHLPKEDISNKAFTENMLNVLASFEAKFSSFSIGSDFNFKNQSLTISRTQIAETSNDGMNGFISVKPFVGLDISSLMKLKVGFNYAKAENRSFFFPYASLGMKLSKDLSLFGELNPHAEYISNGDFLRENIYNIPTNTPNVFLKKKFALNGVLKYEYDKYFEIDAGASYFKAKDLPYFSDENSPGKFAVALTDADSYTAYVNLLFHAGPYGIFYGNAELNSTKDGDGNIVPYYPQAKVSLVYGYGFFENKLNAEAGLDMFSEQYTDIKNNTGKKNAIPSFIDLRFKLKYEIIPQFQLTFEMTNLLNRDNYLWNYYYDIPLNVIGGLSFKW
jgi:hypothetical protein